MPMEQVSLGDAIPKRAFHARLRAWLDSTDDTVVGDPDVPGVKAWVHVRDGDSRYKLYADTRRDAVADYLRLVDQWDDNLQ
jgi:hypothetical protein